MWRDSADSARHVDFAPVTERERQVEKDRYYMQIAQAVCTGADCLGSRVGAVLVLENRVIGTGYNGTPAGFTNCRDGGCVRCRDSQLIREGKLNEASDPGHTSGKALDRCICVHAEQNSLITAARFGIRVEGSTLYTTLSPCFGCLKEAVQAGVSRIVYADEYPVNYGPALIELYRNLAMHLAGGDATNFEPLGGTPAGVAVAAQPDPYSDEGIAPVAISQIQEFLKSERGSSGGGPERASG